MANPLLLLPPFRPPERCALTCVESIICMAVDRPFPASSRNRFSQMPRRPQPQSDCRSLSEDHIQPGNPPAAAILQHVYYAADNTAIINPIEGWGHVG